MNALIASMASRLALEQDLQNPPPANLQKDEEAITAALQEFAGLAAAYDSIAPQNDPADVNAIRAALAYSYPDDGTARTQMAVIYSHAAAFLSRPLPDLKLPVTLLGKLQSIRSAVDHLKSAYSDKEIHNFLTQANKQIDIAQKQTVLAQTPAVSLAVTNLNDALSKIQKLAAYIDGWKAQDERRASQTQIRPDASVQVLPVALYSESKVAVQVKCTDAVTTNPLFDSIQFNAYFQAAPVFDISSGVLISTLHGRQASTQTRYGDPSLTSCPANPSATPPTTSDCPTVVINRTRPQFIPGVFAELHWWNFKLPGVRDAAFEPANPPGRIPTWMSDRTPRHPVGYVGSFGISGGILANPNNGTTQAEFFEGVSLGIQRFVFLIGNHNGHSQNLTNGYTVGAPVASGTTPATVLNWANGLAFGLTYRIPLR